VFRVTVSCVGLSAEEAKLGVTDLLKEFHNRPWQRNVSCHWNGARIVLSAESEHDPEGSGLLDELSDAVHACIDWSGDQISFAVESVVNIDRL
jgi:hypothetical protein